MMQALVDGLDAPSSAAFAAMPAESLALGEGPARWALAVAGRAVEPVLAVVDAERGAWLAARLRPAVEQTVLDLLVSLRSSPWPRPAGMRAEIELNPPERNLVTDLAVDGAPFARIVQGLRIVQAVCAAELLDVAEAGGSRGTALLRGLAESVAAFFDASVDAVLACYLQEQERLISRRLTARRAMVSAILGGETVRADDARRSLDMEIEGPVLAMVARTTAPTPGVGDSVDLEQAVRRAAAALRCRSSLTVPSDEGLWIWLGRDKPFTAADLKLLYSARVVPDTVRLAVGVPAAGLDGFRRSHIAAQDAARLGRATRGRQRVVFHSDVALLAVLLADPERARWFVAEQLGKLAGDGALLRGLRLTLLAYLDSGGSLVGAAAAVHVHRNTVVYRLRKAEEFLGRPVDSPALALHTALLLAAELTDGD